MRRIGPDGMDVTESYGLQGPRDEIRLSVEEFSGVIGCAALGDLAGLRAMGGRYCGAAIPETPRLKMEGAMG